MEKPKFPTLLLILSILAIMIAILANKNQYIVFNLAFAAFAIGLFLSFAKTED
jgi:uncharacterized membrane protein YciS (DUF1049 family)